MEQGMKKFQEIANREKILMLAEAHSRADAQPQEDRDQVAEMLSEVTKEMRL
jgi:regulator of sirC expression with transglutaminase-like and TPR domain